MLTYIGIDDTDNLEVGATGETANHLIKLIESKHWGRCQAVTRHQLYLHPDIPYTSHNSSMCFAADMETGCIESLMQGISGFLKQESAPGSDPGFCLAIEEQIRERDSLIDFGYEAKKRVVTKAEAYELAKKANIHLSEHGGTGLGVIGALAGVGLRMTNNDGRFQGKLKIKEPGTRIKVGEMLSKGLMDSVQSLDGYVLDQDEEVRLGEKLKTVLLGGKRVFLVYQREGIREWETCLNNHLEKY